MLFVFLAHFYQLCILVYSLLPTTETVYGWLNYLLLPVFNVGIALERKIVDLLDKQYANRTITAYTINRIRAFKGQQAHHLHRSIWSSLLNKWNHDFNYILLDVKYNQTNTRYQIPITELEQLRYIINQHTTIMEPQYRFLRRSKPSALNMIKDHRQIIAASLSTGAETHDVDLDIIHRLAGPNGDFFADLPGDKNLRNKSIRDFLSYETAIGNIKEVECFLSTGDNIFI